MSPVESTAAPSPAKEMTAQNGSASPDAHPPHRPAMIIVCCVCQKQIGALFCTPEMSGTVTHGYCSVCFDEAMIQVRDYWRSHQSPFPPPPPRHLA